MFGAHGPFRFDAPLYRSAKAEGVTIRNDRTASSAGRSRRNQMRAIKTHVFRCMLASLLGLAALACLGAGTSRAADDARQPVAIQFSFDRPLEASMAPFAVALDHGLFSAEGLAVTTNIASGSPPEHSRAAR